MKRRYGFTLVELLTVLAIIAILAAIIFPVYARAKDSANRNGDLSALNEIRSALQLYRVDQGGYPPALLGFVGSYATGPNAGQTLPADALTGFLYPKRVSSLNKFKPVPIKASSTAIATAVWPNQDPRAIGQAAQVDTDGDGSVTPADDILGARQAYGPTTSVVQNPRLPGSATNPVVQFYQVDGYDVAEVPTTTGAKRWEIRYALFWTDFAIGQGAGMGSGSANDDPRQLGYADPPDNTVVTWNSYYRDWTAGVPARNTRDMILFLSGGAKVYDSRDLHERSWRSVP